MDTRLHLQYTQTSAAARMVVLDDSPRIVASLDTITTVEGGYKAKDKECHCFHIQYKR